MSYMVEMIDKETKEPVKTLGPMTERKAGNVMRSLRMSLDDDKYFVQTVEVTNEINTDHQDTQPMDTTDD